MKDYYLVYRVESCNFCDDAVNLLKEKEEPFVIMDMTSNPEIVQEVKKQNKMTTVPIVQFVCEKDVPWQDDPVPLPMLVGGYDELVEHFEEPEEEEE